MGGGTESKGTESRRQRSCFPATHSAVSPTESPGAQGRSECVGGRGQRNVAFVERTQLHPGNMFRIRPKAGRDIYVVALHVIGLSFLIHKARGGRADGGRMEKTFTIAQVLKKAIGGRRLSPPHFTPPAPPPVL